MSRGRDGSAAGCRGKQEVHTVGLWEVGHDDFRLHSRATFRTEIASVGWSPLSTSVGDRDLYFCSKGRCYPT